MSNYTYINASYRFIETTVTAGVTDTINLSFPWVVNAVYAPAPTQSYLPIATGFSNVGTAFVDWLPEQFLITTLYGPGGGVNGVDFNFQFVPGGPEIIRQPNTNYTP